MARLRGRVGRNPDGLPSARRASRLHLLAIWGHLMRQLWSFLNSAFGIWLLTTVVVGFSAAVWADNQNCRVRTANLSERYSRIAAEVEQRVVSLCQAILKADSYQQAKSALSSSTGSKVPYRYLEFKDRTLDDLEEEYFDLAEKLEFPRGKPGQRSPTMKLQESQIAWERIKLAISGEPLGMAELKRLAEGIVASRPDIHRLDLDRAYGYQCSIWNSVKSALGSR
jgi:hypothetical protein